MATYAFKALDLAGAPSKGQVEASDKQAVASQLRSKGLIVVDIEEKAAANAGDLLARFKKVKADDLVIASRQLATMVQSGMSLLRALYVIEEQTESDKLRETFVEVRKDVEAGLALSDALKKHPDVFNELYVAMVQAGETGGILDQTLVRVATQLEKDAALRRQIKAAMVYPSLIGGFALIVLVALVAFLVPVFEKIFDDFGGELPAITKFTVWLSHMMTGRWYVMIGVGEETGALETMMSKVADFYEEQVEAAVKALTSILEPVMIVIVGGIVGFIVVSMYLPLFDIYKNIR